MTAATVSLLSFTPVKGLALRHPEEILLGPRGLAENRRFYLVDADGRRFGAKECGALVQVAADYEPEGERLTLRFPDGTVVEGEVRVAEAVETDFWGRPVAGRVVEGPWASALSEHAGRPVRLAKTEEAGAGVDRGAFRGPVSLVSEASLDELARHAATNGAVDGRRFRMLVTVTGCRAHEEDAWLGRPLRLGEAVVRLTGAVGRCVVTTRNPDSGVRDLDTLGAIYSYRGRNPITGELDMGVYGTVLEPGAVRVGDPVQPL